MVKQLKNELYLFEDKSGEVEIEIDDKDFRNIKLTADDKVRIKAEVDSDLTNVSLEAEYLELVK
ncbi:NirD/YgiW/YdeI family stress tolerance protein [Candidatus Colwellia aromaticivorans]|uniref:NirD/YgiW/YdeI family stress tolerance protein n=1 Tax=Candidatus Colwellia aromaticivorans TaxID=2267621 RepID=UPI000DF1A44A